MSPWPGCLQWPDEDQGSSSRPGGEGIQLHLDNEAKFPSRTGRGLATPTAGQCHPRPGTAARRPENIIKI